MEKWYIVHTRPRWEKKLTDVLEQKGIESYCPVKTFRRKWSDRIKIIEEPKMAVRLTDGVVNFVYKNGKPALVKEKEIKAFKKLLDAGVSMEWFEKNGTSGQVMTNENNRQHKAFQFYLNSFTSRLISSVDSPKLV
jgi:transcription antitermination factor NusG